MSLFIESVATIIILVTKPFSLMMLTCIFGVKSICIVIYTWIELLWASICLHVNIFRRFVVWNVALISLPARILKALRRERLLEMHLHDMQDELEAIVLDRKELEEQLKVAIRERRMMEMMLEELEEEHDQAINKIELLEGELQDLKHENHRLKEVQSKDSWSSRDELDTDIAQKTIDALKYGIPSGKTNYIGSGTPLEDLPMQKHAQENEIEGKHETHNLATALLKSSGLMGSTHPFSPNTDVNESVDEQREVAISQSLFSAILSLLVGIIVFEAEDPCMPLVVALFFVVGMSLKSVVQFFSTIKNKPASDAVALLSFNWFILGTLTYPTLPRVARIFAPFILRFLDRELSWLGLSS